MNAADTRRGSKLSDLIRQGATGGATVRIHLNNKGDRAHKPELYGDLIIVERTIMPSGVTSSKICDKNNKAYETKKKDVEALASKFGLHVDNPCCVLDQEHAKLFLKGNEQQKYQFFLKATDL